MVQMLPPFVPARVPLIYATGLLEWAIALGFFVPRFRTTAGIAAAAVLIAFFPANIYAAFARVPMGGHEWGPVYLLIRAPLQLAILIWIYHFVIRPGVSHTADKEGASGERGAPGSAGGRADAASQCRRDHDQRIWSDAGV